MSLVVDTNILIDILRGHPPARDYYRALGQPPVCSEVSRAEVLRGMRAPEKAQTRQLLAAVDWVAVDARVSTRAGELGRGVRRSHQGIGVADLVVAATADLLGVPLVTTNRRHFPMLDDVVTPYTP